MLELHINFPEAKDAYEFNTNVCEFFKGAKKFIENEIIVSPVVCAYVGNRKMWMFDICFVDETIDRKISITGGELLLKNGIHNVWAFSKMNDYFN